MTSSIASTYRKTASSSQMASSTSQERPFLSTTQVCTACPPPTATRSPAPKCVKVNKYYQHAIDAQTRFIPLIADRFGRLHGEFHKFIQLIDTNSLQCGTPSATRMSQTQFEVELAILSGNSGLPRSFFPTSSAAGKHDTVLSGREASTHTDYLGYMCFFLITSMFK